VILPWAEWEPLKGLLPASPNRNEIWNRFTFRIDLQNGILFIENKLIDDMSFGFSVSDFINVGKIVLRLYNACQNAPREFQDLSSELSSIHIVLFGLAEQARDPTSLLLRRGADRGFEWTHIRNNLQSTLAELQDLVSRYQATGRSAWHRMRLGSQNLSAVRLKLDFHLSAINTFVGSLALSALGRMEPVLGRIESLLWEYVREERAGHKTPTVLTAHETNDMVSWKQVEMDLLLEGIPREDFERNRERIRELLDWVVSNECDLASLSDIEPDDSVSCIAARRSPFDSPVSKLHSSALSIIDEIFGPLADPDIEGDVSLKSTYQTYGPSPPSKFNFDSRPTTADEVFGPPSFDQEVEKAFYLASSDSMGGFDDVWKSLDLEPSQPTEPSRVPKRHHIAINGQGYFSPLAADHTGNTADLFPGDVSFQYSSLELPKVQVNCGEDDYQASDTASMMGPQIFWRGSEWSTEEDHYMAKGDYDGDVESAYSDSEVDSEVNTSDGTEISAFAMSRDEENHVSESTEINKSNLKLEMAGWIPLAGEES
jgi:hypothetical protein